MDKIYNGIKDFFLNQVNETLSQYEDEEISLPEFTEKFIVFGTVDMSRYKNKIIVSVLPEEQNEDEGDISDYKEISSFLITIICSQDKDDVLIKRLCRYAAAFRDAVLQDCSMGGAFDDAIIGTRTFYADAGTAEQTVSAVEIGMTISTDLNID